MSETPFNSYTIIQSVHRSRRFSLYQAIRIESGETVFIKTLDAFRAKDSGLITMLKNEIAAHKMMQHPHIRACEEGYEDENSAFLIGEYIEGTSLAKYMVENPAELELSNILDWLTELLDAVSYAHRKGVLHLNLNPYNILVDSSKHLKIIGYGKAKTAYLNGEEGFSIYHPILFVAPELFQAGITLPQSDIYSIAVIAYLLLCGVPPWRVDLMLTAEKQKQQSLCRAVIMPEILKKEMPDWLFAALLQCLKLDPHQRAGSAEELLQVISQRKESMVEIAPEPELLEPAWESDAEFQCGSGELEFSPPIPEQLEPETLEPEILEPAEPTEASEAEIQFSIEEPEPLAPEVIQLEISEPEPLVPIHIQIIEPELVLTTADEDAEFQFGRGELEFSTPIPELPEPETLKPETIEPELFEPELSEPEKPAKERDAEFQFGRAEMVTSQAPTPREIPPPQVLPPLQPKPRSSKYQSQPWSKPPPAEKHDDASLKKTFKTLLWLSLIVVLFILVKYVAFGTRHKFSSVADSTAVEVPEVEPKEANQPLEMIAIPVDTLIMGSITPDAGDDEFPLLTVKVAAFSISKTEITQAQWLMVFPQNPASHRDMNLPVDNVSFYDAIEFCNAKSQKDGLSPCYDYFDTEVVCNWDATGYRLPTEAEWEFAAKSAKHRDFFAYSGGEKPDELGWHSGNSNAESHPVGKKKPNQLGLYDLSGNLYEWVWNWYAPYTYKTEDRFKGPNSGTDKVIRGGSWYHPVSEMRVTNRSFAKPYAKNAYIGFRVVKSN